MKTSIQNHRTTKEHLIPVPIGTSIHTATFIADSLCTGTLVATCVGEPLRPETVGVLFEIARERIRQDEIHGGPEHDDTHTHREWMTFIFRRACNGPDDYRKRLLEIAALAAAAIESIDRVEARSLK